VFPGAVVVWLHRQQPLFIAAALVALWSTVFFVLGSFVAGIFAAPASLLWVLAMMLVVLLGSRHTRKLGTKHAIHQQWLFVAAVLFVVAGVLSLPFFLFHDGLPTGDSQKSIIWGQQVIQTGELPNYSIAPALLNRDPVDFYTPALHTYTALAMRLSPAPLTAVGFLAICIFVATILVAVALARALFPTLPKLPLVGLTSILLLTHIRFLRYVREPGYHWQNLVGEFLLFGSVLAATIVWLEWQQKQRVNKVHLGLLLGLLVSLVFSHQFSAFIAGFVLLPYLGLLVRDVWQYRQTISRPLSLSIAVAFALLLLGGVRLNLQSKIGHLFTTTPHLLDLSPALLDYPRLLGATWLLVCLFGLVLIAARHLHKREGFNIQAAFMLSTLIALLLSQGPRLGIDIPPVRALLYTVVPLSIFGAVGMLTFWQSLAKSPARTRRITLTSLLLVLTLGLGASARQAWSLTHTARTNSTLTAAQLTTIHETPQEPSGAVLVDDFNRRSSSWLVLSGRAMYTRIASDLSRQMKEARQSQLRYQLYLHQLDYEKIFSLGSSSLATDLMAKHGIALVTGIANSSEVAFSVNPNLAAVTADDITLYRPAFNTDTCTDRLPLSVQTWLLRPAVLANNFGDAEDTWLHLPASLRSSNISEPHQIADCQVRTTSAQYSEVYFNIGDYTQVLIDQDGDSRPDTALEALIDIINPPADLQILDATGAAHPYTEKPLRLTANQAPIDDQGFIGLTIENPSGQPIHYNVAAIGPAHIP